MYIHHAMKTMLMLIGGGLEEVLPVTIHPTALQARSLPHHSFIFYRLVWHYVFVFCFSVVEEHATVEAAAPEKIITQEADDDQGETLSPEQHQPEDVGEFQEFAGAEPSVEKEEQQQQPEEIITSKSKSESLLEESAPVSAPGVSSVESDEEEGCEKESERRWSNPFEAPVVDEADVDPVVVRDVTDDALKTVTV